MLKNLCFVIVLLAVATPAFAQSTFTDHWSSAKECLEASGPFYVPRVKNSKLVKRGEQINGYEWGGCFEMELPQEDGGRGWVRLPPGTRFVVSTVTGKVLRLEECDNIIYAVEPFPVEKRRVVMQSAQVDLTGMVAAIDRSASRLSKSIEDAAANLASAARPPEQPVLEDPVYYEWWNIKGTKGKIFWGAVGAVAVGGIYCATTDNCRNVQKVTVIVR